MEGRLSGLQARQEAPQGRSPSPISCNSFGARFMRVYRSSRRLTRSSRTGYFNFLDERLKKINDFYEAEVEEAQRQETMIVDSVYCVIWDIQYDRALGSIKFEHWGLGPLLRSTFAVHPISLLGHRRYDLHSTPYPRSPVLEAFVGRKSQGVRSSVRSTPPNPHATH